MSLCQLLYSTVGRLEEFIVETFRVKPSSDSVVGSISAEQRLVIEPTSVSAFHRRLFSYADEFNELGIGKLQ